MPAEINSNGLQLRAPTKALAGSITQLGALLVEVPNDAYLLQAWLSEGEVLHAFVANPAAVLKLKFFDLCVLLA